MVGITEEVLWRNPAPEKDPIVCIYVNFGERKRTEFEGSNKIRPAIGIESSLATCTTDSWGYLRLFHHEENWIFDFAFRHFNFVHDGTYSEVVNKSTLIETVPEWFKGVKVNFAENLLYSGAQHGAQGKRSTRRREDGKFRLERSQSDTRPLGTSPGVRYDRKSYRWSKPWAPLECDRETALLLSLAILSSASQSSMG